MFKIFRPRNSGLRKSNSTEKEWDAVSTGSIPSTSTTTTLENVFQWPRREQALVPVLENGLPTDQEPGWTWPGEFATVKAPNSLDPTTSTRQSHQPSIPTEETYSARHANITEGHRPAFTPWPTSQIALSPAMATAGAMYVPFVDSTLMKACHTTRPGYGRINPAILGDFDDFDAADEISTRTDRQNEGKRPDAQPVPQPSAIEAVSNSHYKPLGQLLIENFSPETTSTRTITTQSTANRGYKPPATSLFADFDGAVEPSGPNVATRFLPQFKGSTPLGLVRPGKSPSGSSGSSASSALSSNNPYVTFIDKQDTTTTTYTSRGRADEGVLTLATEVEADDQIFGKRYTQNLESSDVVISRTRISAPRDSAERECSICAETRHNADFPLLSITANCAHPPEACFECVQTSIRTDLSTKLWTNIRCLECSEPLDYVDVQRYADEKTFARYEGLALRAVMSEAPNFRWCPSACGSGQIHMSGSDQPIVTCLHCGQRSCFVHEVAWHENMSCCEYDKLQADPENFQSQFELDNDEWERIRQQQEDADRVVAQGILAADEAEMRRKDEQERKEREQARKAAELARQVAARQKKEEEKSQATIKNTTKPCPSCGWAIEKNKGCSHMTCIKCKYEFCWGCYSPWGGAGCKNIRCTGARARCSHEFCYECGADHEKIIKNDNSYHAVSCKFHPNNMSITEYGEEEDDEDEGDDGTEDVR